MRFDRAVLWLAIGGIPALVLVSVAIGDPHLRAVLAVLSITPLLYVTIRLAQGAKRWIASERRKHFQYRTMTDEFLTHVRYLNKLALTAKRPDAPSGLDSQIEQVLKQMHDLVEWLGKAAGKESGPGPDRPGR